MKRVTLSLFFSCLLPFVSSGATDLKQSKFTQVVNQVEVIAGPEQAAKAATVNDLLKMPDILRTGPASRAELISEDNTVTRVGANTIFSFESANRTINLQKGSLLFHSPKGKGGGTIQTGAATASVLGTTIVVVTTPDGGFKVLVLEGEAEVKFLSGLAQHLNAGQLIFVLPGGSISPVVMFRLDQQTKGSKLVGGFQKQLPSLDKINNAVSKQLKLIEGGGAADTGLLVGDSATATSVQASTVQSFTQTETTPTTPPEPQLPPSGPTPHSPEEALLSDATISSPTLDLNRVFLGEGFDISESQSPYLSITPGNPYLGFAGHTITISTPTIDGSPFQGLVPDNYFDFVALIDLNILSSVTFTGVTPEGENLLYLSAGNRLTVAPNSTVRADFSSLVLSAFQPMDFSRVHFISDVGDVDLINGSEITLRTGSTISAPNGVSLFSSGNINILSGSSVTANTITLNAGDGILLDNVTMSGNTVGTGRLSASAPNTINVGSASGPVNLTSLAAVNMSAITINLLNVAFGAGSVVDLASANGLLAPNPNTGAASLPGYVNFIRDVTYAGTPAQNHLTASPGTAGIFIHGNSSE